MQTNKAGLDLIKEFEGLRLEAYQDSVGVWTIGYGHTGPEVHAGMTITQEKAEELLKQDLAYAEKYVERYLTVQVTPNQFAAMVSFTYNLGPHNFKSSTLLRCVNKRNPKDAANEFEKWCKAGGIVVPGLLRRRKAERDLFLRE